MGRLSEDNQRRWTAAQIALCGLWTTTTALAAWYAVRQGLGTDQLCLALFVGSVLALGAYDTRHNQPTQYNLLRSWPFGSAADDEARGRRTVSSQALHAMTCVSLGLCVCRILSA
jgi:hypothetical protein